jgi:beta-N-acetylhexosaminidase
LSEEFSDDENTEIEKDKIKLQISNMEIEDKIGQLLIVGIEGYELNQDEIDIINKYNLSGFIFFDRNIDTKDQFINLINNLKDENKGDIPYFLSVDEEGGRVERLDKFYLKMPSMDAIGKTNDEELAYKVGTVLGSKLKTFGLNMNFAPVLDINSNPLNEVIGDRSLSDDPYVVAKLGNELVKGMSREGIVAVGKHFPGHGDTQIDSHYDLPIINKDLMELETLELEPFIYNINNGMNAIMVGHLLLPELSSEPSSLSYEIINGILRKKLKFNGVVLSDDMTMGAITNNYDIKEAVLKFLIAGGDIALICHDNSQIVDIVNYIKLAVENGTITEAEIDDKLYRILSLKKEYDIYDEKVDYSSVDNYIEKINDEIKSIYLEVE